MSEFEYKKPVLTMPTLLLNQAIKISLQFIAAFTYDMKLRFF